MDRLKASARTGWVASDAAWTLAPVAALVAAAFVEGMATRLGLVLAGLVGIAAALGRQGRAERLAFALCGDGAGRSSSLLRSLQAIGLRLKSLEHRTSNTNPVTGLATRERLLALIEEDANGAREAQVFGALRLADFDRLAAFDHAGANTALCAFAERIAQASRPGHVIAQIDRDCLAVWFRGVEPAVAAAELRAIAYVAGREIAYPGGVLTPAIEVATLTSTLDAAAAPHMLQRLTAGLQRPSVSASGGLTLAEPVSPAAARERFELEQDLAQAIAEDQLTMVFQPVIDHAAARVLGAEALLRWDHPRLGPVSPARFIPIVEATGLSERYGLWVLNAACREARRWQDEGLVGLKVAVNLSAHQLLDPALLTHIERTLERHDLQPRALELELTETAAMADADRTLELFGKLRALGVSLAIDDFGSGYSSLSYLKNLPFDKLKIDREFVTQVDARRDSRAICRALIELGRGLDLVVLAEGVETVQEVAALRELGCNVFQGYYFSKPLAGEDFRAFVADPAWRSRLVAPSKTRLKARLSA